MYMKMMSVEQMLFVGGIGTFITVMLASLNWRRAVFAAFFMALFEGAIRKWLLPSLSELVYFGKDIVLFGAYLKFYFDPDPDIKAYSLRVPGALISAVCMVLIIGGAMNPNIGSFILAVYGIKIYLWYVPLAFMMPYVFRNQQDLTNKIFWYSTLAIPICLLGAAQFVAGPDSPLNCYAKTIYTEMSQIATFGAGSTRARISGTFSYLTGFTVFVVLFFVISLALLTVLTGKRRLVVLFGNLPLLAANSLMSGSRGAVYSIIICSVFYMLASSIYRVTDEKKSGGGAAIYIVLGFGVVAAVTSLFFKDAVNEFQLRRRTTNDTTYDRLITPLWSVGQAAREVGLGGYGIGLSHPASEAMRSNLKLPAPKQRCPVYDSEMGQVLAELGWPGFLMWYYLRFSAIFATWNAFKRAQPSLQRALYLACFCYQSIFFTAGVVLNHTANFFVFATWGFCLLPQLYPAVGRRRPGYGDPVPMPSHPAPRYGSR